MLIEKIIDIQKVGRFEKLCVSNSLRFSKLLLIFGENGWGKSTIADTLRSLTLNRPEIMYGRKTLPIDGQQKVILLIDGKQTIFDGENWIGARPAVVIFDQSFVNENVYSGDNVSHTHLVNQYGLVLGARGVEIVEELMKIDEEFKDLNLQVKEIDNKFLAIVRTIGMLSMSAQQFSSLAYIPEVETKISEKEQEIKILNEQGQIRTVQIPELIPLLQEANSFKELLDKSVECIASDAYARLRNHIDAHKIDGANKSALISHEAWIEIGLQFNSDKECAFCGQAIEDRQLIDAYRNYFSDAYLLLSDQVRKSRTVLDQYKSGMYSVTLQQRLKANSALIDRWNSLTGIEKPKLPSVDDVVVRIKNVSEMLDEIFANKQINLISKVDDPRLQECLDAWEACQLQILSYNTTLSEYIDTIKKLKEFQGKTNSDAVKNDLLSLKINQQRYSSKNVEDAKLRELLIKKQSECNVLKIDKKNALMKHTESVTKNLGVKINGYLKRLGAGFRIDYQKPNFRGTEPAAAYSILINDIRVDLRVTEGEIGKPSFKNTLSTGDKSVLALALFLATMHEEKDISNTVVIFDVPFTSMDEFRRTFTANEINKLSSIAAQVIIFSHEKYFLRLLWDRIDHGIITSAAIQTGAPGIASLVPFDLELATKPRYMTEREKIMQFLDVTEGDPNEIRHLLRNVLEHFYRNGDDELFKPDEMLDAIIRKIKTEGSDYRYFGALTDLEEINYYTRNYHHAPVPGSVIEDTNIEELKTYCERVRDLTRGI